MFNSVNLGNFCPSQTRKERGGGDFGDRAGNLYLPSCTYYVPDFPAVPPFAPARQISYPYAANLAQVPREVPYALEPSAKWHPRGNYAACCPAEELLHRECIPPAEVLVKSDEFHQHHHHRGSVLPQGFDRFLEGSAPDGPHGEDEEEDEEEENAKPGSAPGAKDGSKSGAAD
uniref:homeobox protein Hox-C11 n=1 Tax=Lonchura striata TaxID=40157 RepID=UPI000B4C4310|nr:homeobox protein Hox-C11a [Lonchura striata domestica]